MPYGTLNAGTITPGSGNTLTINEIVDGTAIKDQDNMSSNSATHLATQQSIKAYVDTAATQATTAAQGVGTGNTPQFAGLNLAGTGISSTAAELNLLDGSSVTNATVSKAVVLDSSGNIALPTGKGIDFSATSDVGGMTSELLDDYEEGTFTATVSASSMPATWEQASGYGYYTKIGRIVHVSFVVTISKSSRNSSGSDLMNIALPFTSSDTTGDFNRPGSIGDIQFLVWPANYILSPVALNNSAFCQIQQMRENTTDPDYASRSSLTIDAPYTDFSNGRYCIFSIDLTYFV